MARVTPLDRLAATIQNELADYAVGVTESVKEATKRVTKAGVKALRAEARQKFKGTGEYAKGWTSTFETGKHSAQGVIYNKDVPGLPHLLENGHAKRGGGRTAGVPHIEPVEEMIAQQFTEEVERLLE